VSIAASGDIDTGKAVAVWEAPIAAMVKEERVPGV